MKGASKVVMAGTLVMVVSLAIILGLVLVLLAELYCSLLIRRRRQSKTPLNSLTAAQSSTEPSQQQQNQSAAPTLSNFYAQGVLHAPRNFLFPAVTRNDKFDLEMQNSPKISSIHHQVGVIFSSPPSHSFISIPSPKLVHQFPFQCSTSSDTEGVHGGATTEQLVYISNPIYDNEVCRPSKGDTPFETPDSSPSRLETIASSGEDDNGSGQSSSSPSPSSPSSLPLTPMKKLPAEACSLSLKDARSLGTSGSSNSNNSSLSSGSPCTSPSW